MAATRQTVSLSFIETEVATNTRHRNESICILFVKGGQAAGATKVQVTSFDVKPNPKIRLCCVWQFVYIVYDNLSMLCMTCFDYYFLYKFCITLSLTCTLSIYYIIHFFQFAIDINYLAILNLTSTYLHA